MYEFMGDTMKKIQILMLLWGFIFLEINSMKNFKMNPKKVKYFKVNPFKKVKFKRKIYTQTASKNYSSANKKTWREKFVDFFTFNKKNHVSTINNRYDNKNFAQIKAKKEQREQQKDSQSYWRNIFSGIGIGLVGGTIAINQEDTKKNNNHWKKINKKSLDTLYEWGNGFKRIFISQEALGNTLDKITYLKELFKKNNIDPNFDSMGGRIDHSRTQEDWEYTVKVFEERAKRGAAFLNKNNLAYITLEESHIILQDAKTLLKSFLLTNNSYYSNSERIEKLNLGRLFTYTKLAQIIEEEGLSHVRLPQKNLIIKDKKTGDLIQGEKALKIIDETIKIGLCGKGNPFAIFISDWSDKYVLKILAERIKRSNAELSSKAYNELKILVSKAPFDIGHDNIFIDDNGDAVIIDTEYKGESAEHSLEKLQRYLK